MSICRARLREHL